MVPPTTDKGRETRLRIIESATPVFLQRGYAGTSLGDVLTASGVTKGGFYFHFPSKAALAVEVVNTMRGGFREEVLALVSGEARASHRIAAIVRTVTGTIDKALSHNSLWALCEELCREPEVDTDMVRPYEDWIVIVRDLLVQAIAQGDLAAGTDVDAAARFCIWSYSGMDNLACLTGTPITPADVEHYLRFTYRAIGLTLEGIQP